MPVLWRSDEQSGAVVADPIAGSLVYPLGSRVNERGHLEIAGCDVVELAGELGTPCLPLRRGRYARPRPHLP